MLSISLSEYFGTTDLPTRDSVTDQKLTSDLTKTRIVPGYVQLTCTPVHTSLDISIRLVRADSGKDEEELVSGGGRRWRSEGKR